MMNEESMVYRFINRFYVSGYLLICLFHYVCYEREF